MGMRYSNLSKLSFMYCVSGSPDWAYRKPEYRNNRLVRVILNIFFWGKIKQEPV
jgi:hypothetical protein